MRRLHVICLTILPLLLLGFFSVQWQNSVAAADACDQNCVKDEDKPDAYLSCISAKKSCLESRIKEAQTQKVTLTNTISIISGRVAVQELQIKQTESELDRLEREVKILTERISGLNVSLDRLSEVLVERVQAHYKASRISHLVSALSGKNLTQVLSRSAYIEETGRQTATAMERAETQRIEYDAQRVIKEQKQLEVETKQKQLETERSALAQQRQEQQYLLQETQSNEQKYQAELAKTLAEITAIQSIIAGKGSEGEGRAVKAGEKIASIISGASVCSNGTHLHLEITQDKSTRDPAAYLKPISAVWSNQPDGSFGFGGDWDWPLSDPARITQGYGMTYFARVRRAYGGAPHTGIDMVSKDGNLTVRAVRDGTLYRGSIRCGSGQLRYVRVDHGDGLNSFYLHVDY